MSFLYPFTISVRRPKQSASVGDRGYGAQAGSADEDVILAGPIVCSIQENGTPLPSKTRLPADPKQPAWLVLVPRSVGLGKDAVKRADIVVDDIGRRFQVVAAIWTSLGFEMTCLLLEP